MVIFVPGTKITILIDRLIFDNKKSAMTIFKRMQAQREIASPLFESLAMTKKTQRRFLNFKKSGYNLTDEKEKNARGK